MKRKTVAIVVMGICALGMGRLLAADGVGFKLELNGQTSSQVSPGDCDIQITSKAWTTGGTVNASGYTVAIKTPPYLDIIEINLPANVNTGGRVNFFNPTILPGAGGVGYGIANVIFESQESNYMPIPAGESNAVSLVNYRLGLNVNVPDADGQNFEIAYTDEATINGFKQVNMVTKNGLSLQPNPAEALDLISGGAQARLDLMECKLLDRPRPDSKYQITITWIQNNTNVVHYKTTGTGAQTKYMFEIFVDGEKDSDYTPLVSSCTTPDCTWTWTKEFNPNTQGGYHKFKVCTKYFADCVWPSCIANCGEFNLCSNECVSAVEVITVNCPLVYDNGPYWCRANPLFNFCFDTSLGSGFVLPGNPGVKDFDSLNTEGKELFKKEGTKMAFLFGDDQNDPADYCIVPETLFKLNDKSQPCLYFDSDWLPTNNSTPRTGWNKVCDPISGIPGNVPRCCKVRAVVLKNGAIINWSTNWCTYCFGWKRGDVGLNQVVDILDVVQLLNGIFMPGASNSNSPYYISCQQGANANGGPNPPILPIDNNLLNISDAIYLIRKIFVSGTDPLFPYDADPYKGYGVEPNGSTLPACQDPWPTGSSSQVRCQW
jgi:hypothetical protein